jgi:hypothetical protein
MVMQGDHWPCEAFREPSALPGRCATCGHVREAHEERARLEGRALPPAAPTIVHDPLADDEPAALSSGDRDEAPINTPADFVRALGDAIEEGSVPGVFGLDDEGTIPGGHHFALVLSDGAPRIRVRVDTWPESEQLAADKREPFSGRYFGIVNVEGMGEPIALFMDEGDAQRELARRRALPEEDDDRLTAYYQVFPGDLVGVWWNSYDSDPRADSPLLPEEVIAVYQGEGG